MATISRNYNPAVVAAYAIGSYDVAGLNTAGSYQLSNNNLRAINGEKDQFNGGTSGAIRKKMQNITGLTCGSSAYSCLTSTGGGWYMVKNGEVIDRNADHCYFGLNGDCTGSRLDTRWTGTSTSPWTRGANLDWLKTFTLS
jgi:hypothetical protein